MANVVVRALEKVTPSEEVRRAPLDETFLTRRIEHRQGLARWLAGLSIAMAVVMSGVFGWLERDALHIDTSSFTIVAGLFVGALAIERLTELLIAPWVGNLAHKTARTIVIGSVASLLGVLVAGGLGLYILEIFTAGEVLHTPADVAEASGRDNLWLVRSIDVFVTGMAIAGGTKPLHDLITGLEKKAVDAKEQASTREGEVLEGGAAAPFAMTLTLPDVARGRSREVDADVERIQPGVEIDWLHDGAGNAPTDRLRISGSLPYRAGSPLYVQAVYDIAYRFAAAGYGAEPELAAPADVALGGDTVDPSPKGLDRRWALDQMRLDDDLIQASHGGEGIKVGHPDTGYRTHRLRPNWDTAAGYDFVDEDVLALDPFIDQPGLFEPDFVPIPGHGTGTASVISVPPPPADEEPEMYSVAPNATIIPYRVMRGPVHLFDSDVAQAVRRAREDGCDVISMSLGGFGFSGLEEEISKAVEAGIIVVAAGGNLVGTVVSPADYPETIAVASSTSNGKPYTQGSSQGPEITITAPGTDVWRASFTDGEDTVTPGTGTSYATAHVAGLAALWKRRHRDQLAALPPRDVPRTFAVLLRKTAQPWSDDDVGHGFGAGLVDARRLLEAPVVGDGAPTRDELDAVFQTGVRPSAFEKTAAIGANLFTGEGTMELRVNIVSGIIRLLGAQPQLAKDMASDDLVGQRQDSVKAVVAHEAAHHYRTDKEFRAAVDHGRPAHSAPGASTAAFAAALGPARPDPERDDAGSKSRQLRKALMGRATIRGRYRWMGLAFVAVAFAVSLALALWFGPEDPLRFATSTTVFVTAFYVGAQALERFVEFTFGRFVFKHQPNRVTERSLVLLGITIALACAVAGASGFRLLDMLAGDGSDGDQVAAVDEACETTDDADPCPDAATTGERSEPDTLHRTVNVFVTGLAIGGGTKPLHDLLTRIRVASAGTA